jgi:hypothetical protein
MSPLAEALTVCARVAADQLADAAIRRLCAAGWRGLSRQVSLRYCVGSRNRLLAALALGGQRSFPRVAGIVGADAGLVPAGKHLGRPGQPVDAGPFLAARVADRREAAAPPGLGTSARWLNSSGP